MSSAEFSLQLQTPRRLCVVKWKKLKQSFPWWLIRLHKRLHARWRPRRQAVRPKVSASRIHIYSPAYFTTGCVLHRRTVFYSLSSASRHRRRIARARLQRARLKNKNNKSGIITTRGGACLPPSPCFAQLSIVLTVSKAYIVTGQNATHRAGQHLVIRQELLSRWVAAAGTAHAESRCAGDGATGCAHSKASARASAIAFASVRSALPAADGNCGRRVALAWRRCGNQCTPKPPSWRVISCVCPC